MAILNYNNLFKELPKDDFDKLIDNNIENISDEGLNMLHQMMNNPAVPAMPLYDKLMEMGQAADKPVAENISEQMPNMAGKDMLASLLTPSAILLGMVGGEESNIKKALSPIKKANELVVAGIGADGRIYKGNPGWTHAALSDEYSKSIREKLKSGDATWKNLGFATPDGKFLTREDALKYIQGKLNVKSEDGGLDYLNYKDGLKKELKSEDLKGE